MAPSPPAVTDGSKTWEPSHLLEQAKPDRWSNIRGYLGEDDFRLAITTAFELSPGDSFTYHATASVNLAQAEAAIQAGRRNGLHAWYVEAIDVGGNLSEPAQESGIPGQPSLRITGYPPASDVQAYISLFDPTRSAANGLKSLVANAKKDSLRAEIAAYLVSKRYLDPSINVPKYKPPVAKQGSTPSAVSEHVNPSLDFWAYACTALEYAGPNANTALVKTSHHILPVYMHHFGCVVPSWESLQIITRLADGRRGVLDMGSGNGYWSLMLRRLGLTVVAVDSGQSRWRTTWISDTVVTDGVQYLRKRAGCAELVLLLVYPIVGGEFTRKVIESYTGDVICVAGTQNGNGYTGFKDLLIDEYMRTEKPTWDKVAQVPLPSFAGKDDALFVFRKRKEP
jgi:hypothetical protein